MIGRILRNALWVYYANYCSSCIMDVYTTDYLVYSDWVYNATSTVGTAHMLKTKHMALWVINALCMLVLSGNHDYSDSRVVERQITASFRQCNRSYNCRIKKW